MTRTPDLPSQGTAVAPRAGATELGICLVVGLAILTAAWPSINVANVEIGDFAANGLLIQDAKHLALLKGNYSRIGVHHPGPAILYVLALGELLFYDLLHLAKSPFSGQLIVGCFYTSAWIALIAREFRKLAGTWLDSLFLTSAFCLVVAFFNYNFFADLWFPNLYVFPFATATLALARLATGRADSLVTLALASGFLFNGHVSFASTLGLMFVCVVIANFVQYRRVPERRVAGALFLRTHRRRIGIGLGVLALFFVPLALETALHFPGPVPAYLGFSTGRVVHTMRDSLLFLADFWGGLALLAGAVATTALVVVASRAVPLQRGRIVALLVVLAASTLALFVYARYGIDYLILTYLGYFYYTTPALLFAIVAWLALRSGYPSGRASVAIVLSVACIFLTYWKIHRPVRDIDQYNQPDVVKLYDVMKAAAGNGRIVLDLDNRQDWGWLWTHLVGAEVIARRRGEDLFCLNNNYHILFTDAARCTPGEVVSNPRYSVRVERGPRAEPVAFEAIDIVFSRYALPDLTDAGYLAVLARARVYNDYLLASGWSPPEGEHVWSSDRESHLAFRVRPGFAGTVALHYGAFVVPGHTKVTGMAFVNGAPAGKFEFTLGDARKVLELPLETADGNVDIRIVVDNPTSPLLTHVGDDPRVLGISLFGLEVKAR